MLGVGGARRKLGREALRGAHGSGRVGGGLDPQAQKRELLRKLQEERQEGRAAEDRTSRGASTEGRTADGAS